MERAFSEETLRAALHGLRLPVEAPGGAMAEILAAAALGLFLAVAIMALLAPLLARRPKQGPPEGASPEERTLALLQSLKARDPALFTSLAGDLYARGDLPDETALRRALEGR